MKCRFCQALLVDQFLDLGAAPPSNAFLTAADLNAPESYFPLRLFTCSIAEQRLQRICSQSWKKRLLGI